MARLFSWKVCEWACPRRELNPKPRRYERHALPLSYADDASSRAKFGASYEDSKNRIPDATSGDTTAALRCGACRS